MKKNQETISKKISIFESVCEISNPIILKTLDSIPDKNTILNEANFGLKYIKQHIKKLKPNSTILEVGAGPCILLSQLSISFNTHSFSGIEPIGPGFEFFREPLNKLKNNFNFNLFEVGYEQFEESKNEKFDFIYLINVFEHLPNWKDFLRFVKAHLKQNGRCVILCPNYSFPYESHFGIPVIFSKSLTYKIFKKYIKKFEQDNSSIGLWSSLNFVKLKQVINKANDLDLVLTINKQITDDLIKRLSKDAEFAKRQYFIGIIAKIVQKIGLIKLFNKYPLYLFQPYMYLEISLKPT
jgi:2-polyprenyl-3-methyl-5-hydroxy-6-metoxy-1,4-benzoquinol methylase